MELLFNCGNLIKLISGFIRVYERLTSVSTNRVQSKCRAKCQCSLYFRTEQTKQESYAKRKFCCRRLDAAGPVTIE